jgi:peptidase E
MRRSGVDGLIRRRVLEQGVLYVGQSAGSIVAGSTVRTAFWKGWDDPAAAPDADWSDEENLQAMGLVEGTAFFPHYEAEQWSSLVEQKKAEVPRVVCLTDDGIESYVSGDEEYEVEDAPTGTS